MAAPDEIELTLRFEQADVDIAVFERSVTAFLGLVRNVLGEDSKQPNWRVSVREGSSVVAAHAPGTEARQAGEAMIKSFRLLRGGGVPTDLPPKAMSNLISLHRSTGHYRVDVGFDGEACEVERRHGDRLALLEAQPDLSKSFGGVEGTLDGAWVELKREFRIKTHNRSIRCTFPDELRTQVLDAAGKRAAVYGQIAYRHGEIVSIAIDKLTVLDDSPAHSWRAARGILRA